MGWGVSHHLPLIIYTSAEGITYLLRATWDSADDQGYADEQVLDSAAEGVEDGSLTVIENDGTLACSSNALAITAQSTPAWTDLGFYSGSITKTFGYGLLCDFNLSTWEEIGIGWDSAANVVDPDDMIYALQANATDGQVDVEGGVAVLTGLSASTAYKLAIVLGGYDSNGLAWRSGETGSSYLYGAAYYYYDGSDWHLLWRKLTDNTGTLYVCMSSLDAVGTLDDVKVPDASLSAVLQPTALSTFTASNSTSLNAITPEVGNGWTEAVGDWDIQSNTANLTNEPASLMLAVTDTSISDVIVDCKIQCTNIGASGRSVGICIRYSDSSNVWVCAFSSGSDVIRIYEFNSGAETQRASSSVSLNVNTFYDFRVIAYGQTIDVYLNGTNKTSYGSASNNETETEHGLTARGDEYAQSAYDNFTVYPRTSTTYDNTFDAY